LHRRLFLKSSLALIVLFCFCGITFAQTENEKQLFAYANLERSREGLQSLQWDDQLYAVAQEHSRDMASKNRFGHKGSDRTDPEERVHRAGIYASRVAENVARDVNVVSAHTSLMTSFYHRANIMNPEFDHVGIAIVRNGEFLYITELFTRTVPDLSADDERKALLDAINRVRAEKKLEPVRILQELNQAAQDNAEDHARQGSLNSRNSLAGLSGELHAQLHINIYTSGDLNQVPAQLVQVIAVPDLMLGVGATRTRGKLCDLGCYVVTIITSTL